MKTIFLLLLACSALAQTPRLVVPVGHTGNLTASAISPDGKYVFTGNSDGSAKLWDISGKEIATFRGHSAAINAVAFSRDGQFILTGSEDHTAGLWEVAGRNIHTLNGHGAGVTAVAFSPDGQFIATGSDDRTAKLWDRSGRNIQTFQGHLAGVRAVAFSPDGKSVLTGSGKVFTKADAVIREDITIDDITIIEKDPLPTNMEVSPTKDEFGTATLFDRETGLEIRTFSGHARLVTAVAFSTDGKYVLTGSLDATAKLYKLETGQEIRTYKSQAGFRGIFAANISPDGKYVLVGSEDLAQCRDLQSGKLKRSFEAHPDEASNILAFSPPNTEDPAGGKYILAGGDRSAALLDWTGKTIRTYAGHSTAVTALAFGEKSVLIGCADGSTKHWNLAETQIQSLAKHDDAVVVAAFSANGSSVLTGAYDNTVKQWDKNGREIQSFTGAANYPPAMALSPPGPGDPAGGKYIVYGTRENTVELWSRQPPKNLRTIQRPVDPGRQFEAREIREQVVSALVFSPADGGKFILLGDADGNLEIRDRDSGELIKSIPGKSETDIGENYFRTNVRQTMTLEAYIAAESRKLEGHTDYIYAVVYSPDGKFFASASADRTAKLWDAQGKLLHAFSHSNPVISAAFSPDGQYLLTGSTDDTLKFWNRVSGALVHTFSGHTATALAFSPDGKFILSGSADNTSTLWDVKSGKAPATLIALDSTDWVVTTPSGLFDASPGAMNLMHYVQGLEVIELEQLKKRYWEPGLLTQIIQEKPLRDVSAFGALPLYPEIEAGITDKLLQIKLTERSGGMGKLSLFVNGNEVAADLNPGKKAALEVDLSQFNQFYLDTNTLVLRAYIAGGWLKSRAYELRYVPVASKGTGNNNSGRPASFSPGLPHLYAIVVGTSEYANATLKLRFPDLDAEGFAQALQASGERLFPERVHMQCLSTAAGRTMSNKQNIRAAFDTIKGQAKAGDILVVYFSGHGITYGPAENSQFYYLTKDVPGPDLSIPEDRQSYTVSSEELSAWIKEIPALKRVLIFDACNSGSFAKTFDGAAEKELNPSQIRAYDEMKDRTGTFILAGAAADKVSFEASEFGQGLLTYSLLQGMSGQALLDDKRVDVMKLFQHARSAVPNLAKGINKVQTPMMAFPKGNDGGSGESFSIGKVDAQTRMPALKQVKPVFIKSVFLEETEKEDVLELGQALADHFEALTTPASTAALVYVPVDKYENGYKISGTYRITGETVQINGILKKGAVKKGGFEIKGVKSDMRGLVEAILEQVMRMMNGR